MFFGAAQKGALLIFLQETDRVRSLVIRLWSSSWALLGLVNKTDSDCVWRKSVIFFGAAQKGVLLLFLQETDCVRSLVVRFWSHFLVFFKSDTECVGVFFIDFFQSWLFVFLFLENRS